MATTALTIILDILITINVALIFSAFAYGQGYSDGKRDRKHD